METDALKVNDADGHPVQSAAMVVWQVADTAKATFAVENYDHVVAVQSEARPLRYVATTHPYDDTHWARHLAPRFHRVVSEELAHRVAHRIVVAGS